MNFRGRYKPEQIGFQVVPMIDILFLLLCFFVTSQIYTQWETEINITVPTARSGELPVRLPGEIIINIGREGQLVVNRKPLDDAGLTDLLNRIVKYFPGQPVIIRADKQTPYLHVVKVLDACRTADIWNISFATTQAEEKPAP